MSFFAAIRLALHALFIHKGRSVLTSLGIVIGISAVIALVSAGDGARLLLEDRLESVGKNLILVRAGSRTQQGMIADFAPLTTDDAAALRKKVGPLLEAVAELQMTQRVVTAGATNWPTGIAGCTPDIQKVRKWELEPGGRFLTQDDVAKQATVCLLGHTVRDKLFPDRSPLGQTIRIDRLSVRVIGVLKPKGRSLNGADQDDQVFVPLGTLQHKLLGGDEKLSMILATVRSEELIERGRDEVQKVLAEQHHLKEGEAKNFDVSSVQEVADLAGFVTDTLHLLVLVIASVSLVVGGIGVMNIMLVSVTERTREIGIRMAVGATPGNVLTQFLLEAMALALVGGLLGIGLGIAAAFVLARFMEWPLYVSPFYVVLACGVSAVVGIVFGYYPAWKASRLDPIEALRYE
jgi:putative ABC transport system permease protein